MVERIGAGGMGVIYRVEHVRMGKIAAMKVLRRDLADDQQAVKRFRREVETVSQLAENLARHREACEQSGHELPSVVPLMRTAFVSDNVTTLARASAALEQQMRAMAKAPSAVLRRGALGDPEDWAIVGEPALVADAIAALEERFGMTHLIVRSQIPGLEPREIEASLEYLAAFD